MGFGLGVHGRTGSVQITAARMAVLPVVMAVLLVAVAGCGNQRVERKSAETQRGGDSTRTASAGIKSRVKAGAARHEVSRPAAANQVRLTQKGCVQFEPRWANIHVGQSLTWYSELKTPATIHVPPGAFGKTEYVVRAGASVSTGPARGPGSYSIWTEPVACQGMPRGVQGSGPGVTVVGPE